MVLLGGETDLRTDWLERTQGNDVERVCHQLCDDEYRAGRGGVFDSAVAESTALQPEWHR
ncbi:hypothetical protein D3C78_1860260 [compost metagenome]